MATNIKNIEVGGTTYEIEDTQSRKEITININLPVTAN